MMLTKPQIVNEWVRVRVYTKRGSELRISAHDVSEIDGYTGRSNLNGAFEDKFFSVWNKPSATSRVMRIHIDVVGMIEELEA